MKKLFALILSVSLLLPCLSFVAIAEGTEVLSGDVVLYSDTADSLLFGGVEYKASDELDFTVNVTVSGSESKYNAVFLNGKKLGALADGLNSYKVSTKDLLDGDNEIAVRLGVSNKTYDNTVVYGTVNLDDIVVESVTFSGVGFELPKRINKYMPIVGASGNTVVEADYSTSIDIGDGWFAETNLGGSTPNIPVSIGYVFEDPAITGAFIVDTAKLPDGENEAVFTKNGETVEKINYIIDNTAPVISFSVANGGSVSRLDTLTYSVTDVTAVKTTLLVDGKTASKINVDKLSEGSHTALVTSTDEAGNTASEMLLFDVVDRYYSVSFNEDSVSLNSSLGGAIYSGDILKEVYMFENRLGEYDQDYLRSGDEVLVSFNNKAEIVTSAIGSSLPYQSFVVDTKDADGEAVMVSYNGETGNGSDIVLKAWNYKESRWDEIANTPSGEAVTVSVDIATYSKDDKMRINAMPDLVFNGSDSILWNSDTQYYSRYPELNELYYKVNEYAVELYNEGDIGYCVHTGDLIDQAHMGDEIANAEFQVADRAQDILDKANVPNGVVSGNHDIMHTTADYTYYYKYFGEERYRDFDWYGGSLNNNMHHYDLVSIGAYDFLFLYIGNYKEAEEDTIAWANAVCAAYPTRNVVVCTHEYILPSGAYSGDRAEIFWNEVVVPNENIIMILCGHNSGVCDQLHQVGDSDRYVLEVLADYQFADLGEGGNGITYVENNCTLDGEGFIRLMTFNEAGQVISSTYSPAADVYNYYPSYSDTFVYDINMIEANRSISTKEFNVLANVEKIGDIGSSDIDLSDYDAFYAELANGKETIYSEIYVLNEYESNYKVPESKEYKTAEPERVAISGYENVNENFRMDEDNVIPDSSVVEVGLDLLYSKNKTLSRTSGSMDYSVNIAENNAITVNHKAGSGGENWVTLANYFAGGTVVDVSKYNRIYFGVTADPSTKWNIYVNFANKELNFSQNKDIAEMFGYVTDAPSDITGTWNGYIDLTDIIQGEQTVKSIYIVSATPDETVTFDYLFLGHSDAGKVRFITSDNVITAYEAKVGDKIELPASPYKLGYTFDGWYTEKEGGNKIEGPITVGENVTEVYARFSVKGNVTREVETFNEELELKQNFDFRIIYICLCVTFLVIAVVVLIIKSKKTAK